MTDDDDLHLNDYLGIARRRWRWLIAVPIMALALGALFSFTRERIYEAEAEVLILTDSSRSLFSASPAILERFGRNSVTELQFLSSDEFRRSVGPLEQDFDVTYDVVRADVGEDVVDTDLLAFTARGPDAAEATAMATRHAEAYIEERYDLDVEANEQSGEQASARLLNLLAELDQAEDDLAQTRQQLAGATDEQQGAALALAEQEFLARSQGLTTAIEEARQEVSTSAQLESELEEPDALARILNPAEVPTAAIAPNVSRNLILALVAGLVVGVGVAITRDLFDRKARDGVALARQLGVPWLGEIRQRRGRRRVAHRRTAADAGAPDAFDPYRNVFNSIWLNSGDKAPRTIAVTSERPASGRTAVALKLAQLEASRGMDVLIVDADTLDASVAGRLGLERPKVELGEAMPPSADGPDSIDPRPGIAAGTIQTGTPRLDYAEISHERLEHVLRTGAFRAVLEGVRREYDLVVLDVPPVHGGDDPRPASRAADATILTYDPSVARTVDVESSIDSLREAGVNVIGLVSVRDGAGTDERPLPGGPPLRPLRRRPRPHRRPAGPGRGDTGGAEPVPDPGRCLVDQPPSAAPLDGRGMTLARSGAGSATHGLGLAPAAGATGAPAGSFLAGSPIDVGRRYLGAVRAQWRFAALFVVFVLVGSSAALAERSPAYEATAELLVAPVEPADASFTGLSVVKELGDPTRTIQTAAALVEDRAIAEEAAERLGEPWTADDVQGAIAVSPQGQTNVLEVLATTGDREAAAELANAYGLAVVDVRDRTLRAEVDAAIARMRAELGVVAADATLTREGLQRRVSELQRLRVNGDPTVSFAEPPGEPSGSASLPPWVVLAVALVAALLVAPGVALLAELLGPRRVRGDGDLVDALDAPVVARIPRERPVRAPWRRLRRRRRRSRRAPADVRAGTGGGGDDDGAGAGTEPGDPAAAAPGRADVRHDEVWAAYRRLAVLVEFAEPPRRSFMVVASSNDDGATTVVDHLARELATPDNPVTVVDLVDLVGLVDGAEAADVVRERPAGGGYLLVDSPPLLECPEALRLAADVDAVLVVARQGRTTRAELTRTRELLDTAGVPSAGSVLLDARG